MEKDAGYAKHSDRHLQTLKRLKTASECLKGGPRWRQVPKPLNENQRFDRIKK